MFSKHARLAFQLYNVCVSQIGIWSDLMIMCNDCVVRVKFVDVTLTFAPSYRDAMISFVWTEVTEKRRPKQKKSANKIRKKARSFRISGKSFTYVCCRRKGLPVREKMFNAMKHWAIRFCIETYNWLYRLWIWLT